MAFVLFLHTFLNIYKKQCPVKEFQKEVIQIRNAGLPKLKTCLCQENKFSKAFI